MDLCKEIAKVEYELYEKSGKMEGRDVENWFEAERIAMARHRREEKLEAGSSSPSKKKKEAPGISKASTKRKKN